MHLCEEEFNQEYRRTLQMQQLRNCLFEP